MSNVPAPQPQAPEASSAERKLWLDYLKTLNDRQLQSARNSGLTIYALLALLGGLCYWAVPKIPAVVADANQFQSALVTVALLGDAITYLSLAYVFIIYFCSGGYEHRVNPEATRRVAAVQTWSLQILAALFSVFQFFVGIYGTFRRPFIRWSVLGLAAWWVLNVSYGASKRIKTVRQARRYKVLVPNFTVTSVDPNLEALLISAMLAAIGMYAGVVLVIYLRGSDWRVSLTSASVFLLIFAVMAILLRRGLGAANRSRYEGLERDVLLDQLDPATIRSRFIQDTVGMATATWLDGLLDTLKSQNNELLTLSNAVKQRLDEVLAIDPRYSTERHTRAQKAIDDLQKGVEKRKIAIEGTGFQVTLFIETHKSKKEHQVLRRWLDEFTTTMNEAKKITLICNTLLAELKKVATAGS